MRITLFDRGHCLAGYPGEGADLSFHGERLSREISMLSEQFGWNAINVQINAATAAVSWRIVVAPIGAKNGMRE
jgi:hypothetical protein